MSDSDFADHPERLSQEELSHRLIVLTHLFRVECLKLIAEKIRSPKEIAAICEVSVSHAAYHTRSLLKHEAVVVESTKARRGVNEHFYRATPLGLYLLRLTVEDPRPDSSGDE
jgi:hypothetical protein